MATVRNQADASTRWLQARQRETARLAEDEQGVRDILAWGDHPVTKKVREAFSEFERKVLRRLKKGAIGEKQWTEPEGRALSLALEFTGLFDEIIGQAKNRLLLIQQKQEKQKQGAI